MAAVEEAPSVAPEASRIRPRRLFSAAGLVVVPLVTVAASYLTLYDDRPLIPAGADTPWYVWRAEVVAEGGLSALSEAVPPTHTEVGRVQPFRAGYPIVAGFLDSLGGVSPRELAYALPGLMGVLAALGAGAYAVAAARESRCAFPIYAVVVGASVNIVLTSVSHADNLIVSAVSVSAAAAALAAADMRA
jgi:hypothetical protein